jgi:hypothetical protein
MRVVHGQGERKDQKTEKKDQMVIEDSDREMNGRAIWR